MSLPDTHVIYCLTRLIIEKTEPSCDSFFFLSREKRNKSTKKERKTERKKKNKQGGRASLFVILKAVVVFSIRKVIIVCLKCWVEG